MSNYNTETYDKNQIHANGTYVNNSHEGGTRLDELDSMADTNYEYDDTRNYDELAGDILKNEPVSEYSRITGQSSSEMEGFGSQMGQRRFEDNAEIQNMIDPSTLDLTNRLNSQLKEFASDKEGYEIDANQVSRTRTEYLDATTNNDSQYMDIEKLSNHIKYLENILHSKEEQIRTMTIVRSEKKKNCNLDSLKQSMISRGLPLAGLVIIISMGNSISPSFKRATSLGVQQPILSIIFSSVILSFIFIVTEDLILD